MATAPKREPIDIAAMFADVKKAFEPLVRQFEEIAKAIASIGRVTEKTKAAILLHRRSTIGGMGEDARRWPDQWQSVVCAGLLCSITDCPSDDNGLGCTHSCHEVRS